METDTMSGTSVLLWTVGTLARRYGEPLHRVEYVVKTRGIRPCGRAGNARVFSEEDAARIGDELRRISAQKEDTP
jgi:hypothetical protein